ncbi:MAG: ATP-binding cassette domain-containing protein, partial [Mailhella sp.]|nr:ATP-binding cassette domain-containing protein [Mailhella sp.]
MDKPVLTFENISKMYELRLLYKNVHFCLYPKQTALVTGKNGSGKSTLLKLAAELTKPT